MWGSKTHDCHVRGLTGCIRRVDGNTRDGIVIGIDIESYVREYCGLARTGRGGIRSDEHASTGTPGATGVQWTKAIGAGIDYVGETVRIFWSACGKSANLVDFTAGTDAGATDLQIVAECDVTAEAGAGSATPYAASPDEEFVVGLWVEDVREVESAVIAS